VLGIPLRVVGASHGNLNYLVNLAVSLGKRGTRWQPAVLTSPGLLPASSREILESSGTRIIDMPYFAQSPSAGRFLRAILGGDPNVRNAADRAGLDCMFENAAYYGRYCGVPVLHWIPDLQHCELPGMFPLTARLRRELLIRCVLMSERSILMSSADACDAMVKYYRADLKRLHIARFASTLISDEHATASPAALAELGISTPFAFVPNQFWRHKNHLVLPYAAKLLAERGINLFFVCTGEQNDPRSSSHFAEFSRLLDECDVRDRFVIPGLVPYSLVQRLHRQCAMLINPSFVEGWNTGVEEAKYVGSRLVLSDIGTHREQVMSYSRARLFDPNSPAGLADAIVKTLQADVISTEFRQSAAVAYGANIHDFVEAVESALDRTIDASPSRSH
jgi:glycosyltransferase involved in cell wall biosynthesis